MGSTNRINGLRAFPGSNNCIVFMSGMNFVESDMLKGQCVRRAARCMSRSGEVLCARVSVCVCVCAREYDICTLVCTSIGTSFYMNECVYQLVHVSMHLRTHICKFVVAC